MAKVPRKRDRNTVSPGDKRDICRYKQSHPKSTLFEIVTHFSRVLGHNIGKSTIGDILKCKEKWLNLSNDQCSNLRFGHGRHEKLEKALYLWLNEMANRKIPVDNLMVIEKAKLFGEILNVKDFSYSRGWLTRFKSRHCISREMFQGDAVCPDMIPSSDEDEELHSVLQDYHPDDIFNMDEIGLLFDIGPNRRFPVPKSKTSKERITVALCANASGRTKIKPFVIGTFHQTRCFDKDFKHENYVIYNNNEKGWMTSKLFAEWLGMFDKLMRIWQRHVILLCDSATSHSYSKLKLTNVKLHFLPASTVSNLQPMETGIMQAFKAYYRTHLVDHYVQCSERNNLQDIDLKTALPFIKMAWDDVPENIISHCFVCVKIIDPKTSKNLCNDNSVIDLPLEQLRKSMAKLPVELTQTRSAQEYLDIDKFEDTCEALSDNDIIKLVMENASTSTVKDLYPTSKNRKHNLRNSTSFSEELEDFDHLTTVIKTKIKSEVSDDESKYSNTTDNENPEEMETKSEPMETDQEEANENIEKPLDDFEEGPGTPLEDENSPPPASMDETEVSQSALSAVSENPKSVEKESSDQEESLKDAPSGEDSNSKEAISDVIDMQASPESKQGESENGNSRDVTSDTVDAQASPKPKQRESEDGGESREATMDVPDDKPSHSPESKQGEEPEPNIEAEKEAMSTNEDESQESKEEVPESSVNSERAESNSPAPMDADNPEEERNTDKTECPVLRETEKETILKEEENESRDGEKSSDSTANIKNSPKLDDKDDEDSKTSHGDNSTEDGNEEATEGKEISTNDIEMKEPGKQDDEDVNSRDDDIISTDDDVISRDDEDVTGRYDSEDKEHTSTNKTSEDRDDENEDRTDDSKTPGDKDGKSEVCDQNEESQDKMEQIDVEGENKETEEVEKEREDVRKSEDKNKEARESTDETTEDKSTEGGAEEQSKTSESGEQDDDDDDVKIINEVKKVEEVVNLIDDDDDDDDSQTSKSGQSAIVDNTNDMGLQISSVTSGATMPTDDKPVLPTKVKTEPTSKSTKQKRPQVCIVCSKSCKCKYNIVRNGDIKHLCDDNCFKKFRSNPSQYLKTKAVEAKTPSPSSNGSSNTRGKQNLKTCHVCQLINMNATKPFCNWHGLDFCDEGCLQKFQNSLSVSCAACKSGIPKNNRGMYVFKISPTDVRSFCSSKCMLDLKKLIRLCSLCKLDLSKVPSSLKAHIGPSKVLHEFCTKDCLMKYEKEQSNADVEILAIKPGTISTPSACSVCNKSCIPAHTVKLNNVVNKLCSSTCLQAFQYANSLGLNKCENCGKVCSSEEAKSFFIQFEGNQKKFCSDKCVETFRTTNQKVVPCAWCSSKKRNFDMIERVDSNNKYQLFCTLNCLSLYRVNLQAKSNLCVSCDHCRKYTPAQYHLTMSDASVRNFCSYNCVMSFQRQFTSGMTSSITPNTNNSPGGLPKQSRAAATKQTQPQQPQVTTSNIPIISNVVSLAPPGQKQQTVNIKTTSQVPVVLGSQKVNTALSQFLNDKKKQAPSVTSTGTVQAPQTVQQQIIVQPPQPKVMKNKSLLCKPFVQTKATSCRPNVQNKKVGTEEEKRDPVLIPVPVPVYLPTPLAMFSNPTPVFYPVPIPIPVPVFIPTTKKSADKILKHIKEIQDKIPTDPLEAELLMMAEAVAGDKESSDSESDAEKEDELPSSFMEELDDKTPAINKPKDGEEDMLQMALRVAEEISEPIMDLEANVEPVAVKTDPPKPPAYMEEEEETYIPQPSKSRRGSKRSSRGRGGSSTRSKRQKIEEPEVQKPPPALLTPVQPPEDANSYLKFTYGVNAWKHWVVFKNSQLEKVSKVGSGKLKLFKTDLLQCTADELNYSLCLFCKEVRKPNGEEYSPDSIYYLCLGIQQYLYENGRVDNIFNDFYYEKFAECLSEVLSNHQPKHNAAGQMLCRIEEEHLWEAKQLGAHSPYVLLNTLIYFHTKYFMMKTPQEHMNMSFTQILKHWRKGGPGKPTTNTAGRSVTLRYYCMGPGGAQNKNKSKEGIPVYETSENLENPLRCPVKLYEFYLSKCPESIKNVNDMFYLVPERSCVPDSPVWYSTQPLASDLMTKMLNRILLVREIQEAHLHAQPIYV